MDPRGDNPQTTLTNVMTKFVVNNRTDALKTDINLFLYDDKLSNCPVSYVDALQKYYSRVCPLIDNKN